MKVELPQGLPVSAEPGDPCPACAEPMDRHGATQSCSGCLYVSHPDPPAP